MASLSKTSSMLKSQLSGAKRRFNQLGKRFSPKETSAIKPAIVDENLPTSSGVTNIFEHHTYPFESKPLPIEIIQLILSQSPDAFSLRNLAFSTPVFYRPFLAAQDFILKDALRNEISPGLLPDALMSFYSASTAQSSMENIDDFEAFMSKYDHIEEVLSKSWSLLKSLRLSQTYSTVKYFANDFTSTLTMHPATGRPLPEAILLHPSERDRIERTLYRIELFCHCRLQYSKVYRRSFLEYFSPCENEQLASIYEYLFFKLSSVYNDVARHDVEWGARQVCCNNEYPCGQDPQGGFLKYGLEWIERLCNDSTHEERKQMLEPELDLGNDFMHSSLIEQNWGQDVLIASLDDADRDALTTPITRRDRDSGPADAWFWAYQGGNMREAYYKEGQRELRQRGYVMFDYDRLIQMRVFDRPFRKVVFHSSVRGNIEERQKREEMEHSWDQRSKILEDGAGGAKMTTLNLHGSTVVIGLAIGNHQKRNRLLQRKGDSYHIQT